MYTQYNHPFYMDFADRKVWADPAGRLLMPIKLKSVLRKYDLAVLDLADALINKYGKRVSRATIYQCYNRGLFPDVTCPDFRQQVETWLYRRNIPSVEIATIWEEEENGKVMPAQRQQNNRDTRIRTRENNKNNLFAETLKEAEMLTPTTMRHFQIFRSPFLDDVQREEDVFMSESHCYAYAAMVDAVKSGGFVAVTAECGGGKSVIRRKLIDELNGNGDVRVVQPQIIDKTELTSGHILDSIILDLNPGAKPKRTKEAKARQVQQALLASSRGGMRHVLIIEEAHDLSVPTMKQLKRLWEIEDGYKKVLGIILIGQPELQVRLNRNTHPEMREVILRCLIATLEPLGRQDCARYIALKFNRIGKSMSDVLTDSCIDAVMKRLTSSNGYSSVYPLYINNLLAKAMNAAAQYGEALVTPEIIEGV